MEAVRRSSRHHSGLTASPMWHEHPRGVARGPEGIAMFTKIGLFFTLLVGCAIGAAEDTKPATVVWSQPSGALSGRLVLEKEKIVSNDSLKVTLEIRNEGSKDIVLDVGNPESINTVVHDAEGHKIAETACRSDVCYCSMWATLPPRCYLGFLISEESTDGAKGSQLDTGVQIWNLPPGKYTLKVTYSTTSPLAKSDRKDAWTGTIVTPPVSFEIVAEGGK